MKLILLIYLFIAVGCSKPIQIRADAAYHNWNSQLQKLEAEILSRGALCGGIYLESIQLNIDNLKKILTAEQMEKALINLKEGIQCR